MNCQSLYSTSSTCRGFLFISPQFFGDCVLEINISHLATLLRSTQRQAIFDNLIDATELRERVGD